VVGDEEELETTLRLLPRLLNGRCQYASTGGGEHLYWTSRDSWILDADNASSHHPTYLGPPPIGICGELAA
jgi:hypothetical protein